MINYPFNRNPKLFKSFPKDNEGLIIKVSNELKGTTYTDVIEFDLSVIKNNFPEIETKKELEELAKIVVKSIVYIKKTTFKQLK